MTICPKCKCELTDADFQSGRCANCQTELQPAPASSSDPGDVTVGPLETLQADQFLTGEEIDESTSDTKGPHETHVAATVDFGDTFGIEEAFGVPKDEGDDERAPEDDLGATQNFDPNGIGATVDFSDNDLENEPNNSSDSVQSESGKVKIRSGTGGSDSGNSSSASGDGPDGSETFFGVSESSDDGGKKSGSVKVRSGTGSASDSKSSSGKVKIRSGTGGADSAEGTDGASGGSMPDGSETFFGVSESSEDPGKKSGSVKVRSGTGSASDSKSGSGKVKIRSGTGGNESGSNESAGSDGSETFLSAIDGPDAGSKSGSVKIRSGFGLVEDGSKDFSTDDDSGHPTHINETMQLDSKGFPIDVTLNLDELVPDSDAGLGATLDPEAAALFHPTWVGALRSNANPTMSLQSDIENSGSLSEASFAAATQNSLHIQTRVIMGKAQEKDSEVPADYGVLSVLGKGGMGIVYSVHQASLDRNVAVKMLLPEGAKNHKARNAFLSEAAITGDLEHPNIVPIYDLGRAPDGAFFYAMKHVHGTPWNKTISKTPLSQNLEYLMKVCDAMAFAHSKGILHRDLKPENTMIGDYGEVMVMDWGLAIPADGRRIAGIDLGQSMAGTPSYMAPEMACGPFEKISTRSDIFLLGAILYEIVTGKPPHTGDTSRACMINAAQNRIRPTEIKSELVDIALKAMQTNQDSRYQTVQEFQDAIREYQSHSESIALSTLAAESLAEARETGEYEDYNRSVFGFQQAIDLWIDNDKACEGLVESKFSYAQRACEKGDFDLSTGLLDVTIPEQKELYNEVQRRVQDREKKEQRSRLYRQIGVGLAGALFIVISGAAIWINSARQEAVTQREAAVLAQEEADIKRAQAIEAQAAEQEQRLIAVQKQKDAEEAKEQEREQRELAEAAQVAEKQQRVAAENARMEAEKAKEAEAEQRVLAEKQKALAEEQRKLAIEQKAFAEQQRQKAIDARQSEAYEAYVARIAAAASRIDENAYLSALELLRDCIPAEGETDYRNWEWGRMVYLCKQATSVLATDGSLETVAASKYRGKIDLVATAGDSGVVTVWDPATGKKKNFNVASGKINSIAFAPSNRELAVGTDVRGEFVQIVNLSTGDVKTLGTGATKQAHAQSVLSVDYSADGKRLLTASRSGKIKVWDVSAGRPLVTLHRHRSAVQQAKFFPSPRGRAQTKIVSVGHDGNAVVWQDTSGNWSSQDSVKEKGVFREHRGPVFAVAISDDGKRIATAGHGGRILIWSDADLKSVDLVQAIENNQEIANVTKSDRLVGHTAAVRSLDFAKSSDLLVSAGHDNTVRVWNAKSGEVVKVLRGHGRWVRGCVVADNGRSVVSAGYDAAARFWDIEGYEELRVLRGKVLTGHQDGIMAADFSGDSQQIVTASRDRTVKSWAAKTGKELKQFREGHRFLASNAVTYLDGRFLATTAGDETVRLWNAETGSQIRKISGTGQGAALDVSRDGRFVLTGGPANKNAKKGEGVWTARLWDGQTGRQIYQLGGHRAMVSTTAISPDGRFLYTGDVNGTGMLWERASGRLIRRLAWHQSKVIRAQFTPDSRQLITASFERGIATWDVATAQVDRNKILLHSKELVSVDIDQNAQRVVTSGEDKKIRVWDVASKNVMKEFEVRHKNKRQRIDKVSISPDGSTIVAVNRSRGTARVFEAMSGREMTFPQRNARGGLIELSDGSQLSTVVFANDQSHVISVGGDQIRMWGVDPSVPQYRRLRMNYSPHGGVATARFSSDSTEIVSGSWDGTANIWNATSGDVRVKLVGRHAGPVHCASFSPDAESRYVATASADRTIVLWDSKTGGFVKRFAGHKDAVNWVAFSPDGKRLVSASDDNTAMVWEIDNPGNPLVFRHDSAVLRALFAPDGKRIASSTFGNLAFVWEVEAGREGKPLFELAGHTAPVTSVAFSPDGRRAITGSEDFTAKVWDVTERGPKELIALSGHERTVTSVAFSPDSLNVLTGSQDGTAIIWMAGPWDEMERNKLQITEMVQPTTESEPTVFTSTDFAKN